MFLLVDGSLPLPRFFSTKGFVMSAHLSKATPGQKAIDVRTWNAMVDMLAWWQRTQQMGSGGAPVNMPREQNIIRIRNDSGYDLPKYSVLQPGEYLLTDLNPRRLFYGGTKPDSNGAFVGVVQWTAPQTDIIEAQVSGVCPVRVNVTDVDHTHAVVVEDETDLSSSNAGPFRMLGTRTETGVQEVVCVIDSTGAGTMYQLSVNTKVGSSWHDIPLSGSATNVQFGGNAATGSDTSAWTIDEANSRIVCASAGWWHCSFYLRCNADTDDSQIAWAAYRERASSASSVAQFEYRIPTARTTATDRVIDCTSVGIKEFEAGDYLYVNAAKESASYNASVISMLWAMLKV